ncbi:carboxymuconolactone decarboxylase family protein [Acidiphilium sp.]|uniref:carboxymuconolactone decarboxylase family protein n=1 Tax=Acidiphilium sp. TaxID=527 RepID=UPI003D0223BE
MSAPAAPRLGPPDPATMTDAQRAVHEAIAAGPRGRVEGPLAVWLHSPDLASRAQALGAYCRFGSALPPRLSELAILIMGAHWQAGFEWHIHAPIAAAAGIPAAAIEAIRTRHPPVLTAPDAQAVHDFTRELLDTHTVSDATYATTHDILGPRALVDLVGLLGYYSLISMTIKAFTLALPNDAPPPFSSNLKT